MIRFVYAALSYAVFLASFLWAVAFIEGLGLSRTIDIGKDFPLAHAIAVDALLLTVFALQHSVMARPAFKRVWTRIVPTSVERATYVLASSLALVLLFACWEPMPAVVWNLESTPLRIAAWAACVIGWLIVLSSTFMIDHFHLFGLKQAWAAMKSEVEREPSFRKVLLYKVVRHPLMLGFVIAFWATPTMTLGHLVFALATTGYILVGVHFEERDLRAALGATYDEYCREVRMLVPIPRKKG